MLTAMSMRRQRFLENLYGVPCGGTHVKSTGEVGSIKLLKRMSKGKGIVRVEYTVEP